jgi:competence protein ComFB
MELVNYMEEVVKRVFQELTADEPYRGVQFSEKMKLDIYAYTLNHLPPRYIVTEKGHLYTRLNELQQQFQTDLVVEITKAIQHVQANPR